MKSLFKIPIAGLHEQVIRDATPMKAIYNFNLISAAGTAVFLAGLCSIFVMRSSMKQAMRTFVDSAIAMRWPVVSISAIIGFAYIMNFSGMASTLGAAFATTGTMFPFFAAFLGWLGVFMTGSDTSSNALFGKLQQETATRIGIDPVVTVSANTVGGVCGKMISPQTLAVAAATVGMVGREGDIFRYMIKHSLILTSIIAVITYLQAYYLTWMIPEYSNAASTAAKAMAQAQDGVIYLAVTLGMAIVMTVIARWAGGGNRTVTEKAP